jgi:regulator of sigma D
MPDSRKNLKERRGQTTKLIDHMLVERNQLLSLLLQTSSIRSSAPTEADLDLLNEFCQVVVDYIAAGHFGLYERIIEKKERRKSVANLAMQVYPSIDETTQTALSFNEKYDLDNADMNLSNLTEDLSRLGEALTARIELEDRLIRQLFKPRESVQA